MQKNKLLLGTVILINLVLIFIGIYAYYMRVVNGTIKAVA